MQAVAYERARYTVAHITFELRALNELATEALEDGTLDFLITPGIYTNDGHPKMALFEDTHICVAWAGNPRIGDKISTEEYLSFGHVIVHVADGQTPNFEELFLRRLKHKRRAEVVTHSFDVVPQLLVGTDRIATITTRLATKYAKSLPLKLIAPPVEIPHMVEMLQWHKQHDRDPASFWLRTRLKRTAARLSGIPAGIPAKTQSLSRRRTHVRPRAVT